MCFMDKDPGATVGEACSDTLGLGLPFRPTKLTRNLQLWEEYADSHQILRSAPFLLCIGKYPWEHKLIMP